MPISPTRTTGQTGSFDIKSVCPDQVGSSSSKGKMGVFLRSWWRNIRTLGVDSLRTHEALQRECRQLKEEYQEGEAVLLSLGINNTQVDIPSLEVKSPAELRDDIAQQEAVLIAENQALEECERNRKAAQQESDRNSRVEQQLKDELATLKIAQETLCEDRRGLSAAQAVLAEQLERTKKDVKVAYAQLEDEKTRDLSPEIAALENEVRAMVSQLGDLDARIWESSKRREGAQAYLERLGPIPPRYVRQPTDIAISKGADADPNSDYAKRYGNARTMGELLGAALGYARQDVYHQPPTAVLYQWAALELIEGAELQMDCQGVQTLRFNDNVPCVGWSMPVVTRTGKGDETTILFRHIDSWTPFQPGIAPFGVDPISVKNILNKLTAAGIRDLKNKVLGGRSGNLELHDTVMELLRDVGNALESRYNGK